MLVTSFVERHLNSSSPANKSHVKPIIPNSPLEDLIPIVNKLQDVFNTIGHKPLDLPQIIVVGSQSAGKSSVLENLVGRDFLPRGSGIVTRRPLVLQLVNVGHQEHTHFQEYGEFIHIPDKQFFDFDDIRNEIIRETERVAGSGKGVSKLPIQLKIYSPRIVNLTLIDLPGIIKLPVGDQPPDIEKQVKQLIREYISKPNSIILAVSPANNDLANSESLKLAREFDPEGKRTMGVLTKLDLMDAGTNSLDILTGRMYPLKHGFVGVVNRSQRDIEKQLALEEAMRHEKEFFKNHPSYKAIAHRCGTPFLAKTLNSILMAHIREKLPDLKSKLNNLISKAHQELQSYGDPIFSGQAHRGSLCMRLLNSYSTDFVSSIEGTRLTGLTTELCGGARMYYIFNDMFDSTLSSINPCANLSEQEIRTAIRNSTGPRPSLFIPEAAFELLIKPIIKVLETPCLRCLEMVYEEMLRIASTCGAKELQRFPKLHGKVMEAANELIRERITPTSTFIENLITVQCSYVNTNHPDFVQEMATAFSKWSQVETNLNSSTIHGSSKMTRTRSNISETGMSFSEVNSVGSVQPVRQNIKESPSSLTTKWEEGTVSLKTQANREGILAYFFGHYMGEQGNLGRNHFHSPSYSLGTLDKNSRMEKAHSDEIGELCHKLQMQTHFIQSNHQSNQMTLEIEEPSPLSKEQVEIELIRSLIKSYFHIVRKSIQDLVPKAIMHLLVHHVRDGLLNSLVTTLYRESLFDELLQEDENLASERNKCKAMLELYRRAAGIIATAY